MTQVVEPKVRAYLYTWGEGRMTAEGEFIPVRVESLDVGYIDGMMCAAFDLTPGSVILSRSKRASCTQTSTSPRITPIPGWDWTL